MKSNDLIDFLKLSSQEIENEYKRIQKRATEDPGTAGDQGEENWATLLRNWLPPFFQIVTKGRILSEKGVASPQVDVLILRPEYPRNLLDKKLYLAGGVVAAFECKVTLKSNHIEEFIKNSIEIKDHLIKEEGSPYKELQSSVLYGLLAHSHLWKKENAIENIKTKLYEYDVAHIKHPFQSPDLICIADLASLSMSKITFLGPKQLPDWSSMIDKYGPNGSATSSYICHSKNADIQTESFSPIGAFVTNLLHKLSWQYPTLKSLSRYFELTDIQGSGAGYMRTWDSSIYSDKIKERVENGNLSNGVAWDEWSLMIY